MCEQFVHLLWRTKKQSKEVNTLLQAYFISLMLGCYFVSLIVLLD